MWQISNSKCEKNLKLKMGQNFKNLKHDKLNNSKCDTTQKFHMSKIKKKTQNVTKLKVSNCDQTQQLEMWQNFINFFLTKQKFHQMKRNQNVKKLKMWPNFKSLNVIKIKTHKMWQNLKIQNWTQLKKTHNVTKLSTQNVTNQKLKM